MLYPGITFRSFQCGLTTGVGSNPFYKCGPFFCATGGHLKRFKPPRKTRQRLQFTLHTNCKVIIKCHPIVYSLPAHLRLFIHFLKILCCARFVRREYGPQIQPLLFHIGLFWSEKPHLDLFSLQRPTPSLTVQTNPFWPCKFTANDYW